MNKEILGLFVVLILLFSLLMRLIPIQGNNFFFTTDQGQDAVFAREIWWRGQIILRGSETGIQGIFALPGWYYFIALGYKLFSGHPFGALLMVILLSLVTLAMLIWQFAKYISPALALVTGAALLVFWPFYDTSRYGFNPFPLVFLAFLEIFLLLGFLQGRKNNYLWALLPIILAFNTEIAGATALFLFYLLLGIWGVIKGKLSWKLFAVFAFIFPFLLLAGLGKQFLTVAQHSQGNAVGTFSGTNFTGIFINFSHILKDSLIPQNLWLSLGLFVGVTWSFLKKKQENIFRRNFVILTLLLFAVSYLFFSTNKGWRDWQTVYLSPLIFVSFILMISSLPKKMRILILGTVLISQFFVFKERYLEYLKPSGSPSLLANEIRVLDFIYQNNEGDGFNVYSYLADSDYDFPYQYLFWWYGRQRYGFVPCEYQNLPYPITLKYTYVPGSEYYNQPTLGCDKFRFLIIEPGGDIDTQKKWEEIVTKDTELVTETVIAGIKVQKRTLGN